MPLRPIGERQSGITEGFVIGALMEPSFTTQEKTILLSGCIYLALDKGNRTHVCMILSF